MKITIKTDELKGAINKVVKGLGNNKLLPITEMLGLNFVDKNLFLVSTDGSTKVQVKLELQDKVDDLSFVVNGKSFTQLVSKTTTENITLNVEKDRLVVKGNGSYTFSFPTDEDGNLVILNNIDTSNYENTEEVSAKEVLKSYEINKSSVAETMETPEYTGFYFDEEGALTTNSLKISYFSNKVFTSKLLLAGKFLSLFSLFAEDNVKIYQSNHEGCIVDKIQEAYFNKVDGIVINPAAYTHTSIALLDALKSVNIPCIEVHISDVSKREEFRQVSYVRLACKNSIIGKGLQGYILAIKELTGK